MRVERLRHFHRSRVWAPLLGMALFLTLAQVHASSGQALQDLITHVRERNALAAPVAESKWCTSKPVTDVAREREVLSRAAAEAAARGVPAKRAERFFAALIEANKQVQYQRLWEWRSGETAPPAASACAKAGLAEVREALNRLQPLLLQDLARTATLLQRPDCEERIARAVSMEIHRQRLHSSAARALVRALGGFCEVAQAQR